MQSSLPECALPKGFAFSGKYQGVPVKLNSNDSTIYYAYEIEKVEGNRRIVGWLIADNNNNVVKDIDLYQKLACAATVTKYIEENPNLSTILEMDFELLKEINWKLPIYDLVHSIIKIGSSLFGKGIIGGLGEAGGEAASMVIADIRGLSQDLAGLSLTNAQEVNKKYMDDFANLAGTEIADILLKTGETIGDIPGYELFKLSSLVKSVIKKCVLESIEKGATIYSASYGVFKNHSGPWSYEDAQIFIKGCIEERAYVLAYINWYGRLAEIYNNKLGTWGLALWDNVFSGVLPSKISDPINAGKNLTQLIVEFMKKPITGLDDLSYNQVEADIKDMTSPLYMLGLFYDVSIKDSPGDTVYSAILGSSPCVSSGEVQLVSPRNGAISPCDNVTFSWKPVKNAGKYEFELYKFGKKINDSIIDSVYGSSITIVSLNEEGSYTWRVRAEDSSGKWTSWSETWGLTIKK
jgi:hypothetical protein